MEISNKEGFGLNSPSGKRMFQALRKRYVSQKWLLANYISWSEPTLRRRINDCDFPFHEDEGGRMYDLDEVDLWFKKRRHREGEVA